MPVMQRKLAIILAVLFSGLSILPAFATSLESKLPGLLQEGWQTPLHHGQGERIGFGRFVYGDRRKVSVLSASDRNYSPPADSYAGDQPCDFCRPRSHSPAVSPQTETGWRISHFRSRQKRGPPSFSPFLNRSEDLLASDARDSFVER